VKGPAAEALGAAIAQIKVSSPRSKHRGMAKHRVEWACKQVPRRAPDRIDGHFECPQWVEIERNFPGNLGFHLS
jgi:hypothetical protein